MPVIADPGYLSAVADRIDAHADATRADGTRLSAAVAAAHWRGVAADAFYAQAGVLRGALGTSAGRLADAAHALRTHAAHVQHTLDDADALLHDVVHNATDTWSLARDTVTHPGRVLGDVRSLAGGAVREIGHGATVFGDLVGLR